MHEGILYRLRSGKNIKVLYYVRAYLRECIPYFINRKIGTHIEKELAHHPDKEYILSRIDYYCRLVSPIPFPLDCQTLNDWHIPKKQKVYYFDSYEITRYFPKTYRWKILPGDIIHVPDCPCIVKSRPISPNNQNSVLLNMDKVRHFVFVNDSIPWQDKQPKAVFRGKVVGKKERMQFMRMYFGSDICDCGDVSRIPMLPKEWQKSKMPIQDHLRYRYIMALEGNDVASNLKWIMSSNSIAVMPPPTCETWFMEGTLRPNYHYIECRPDFSDLSERIAYYNAHPTEAETIIQHAHEYVAQFRDTNREKLIAYGTLKKYFQLTQSTLPND